ncbi:MAG: diacylglycerol kinase family protein [Microcoleaceae cyanobacterium]
MSHKYVKSPTESVKYQCLWHRIGAIWQILLGGKAAKYNLICGAFQIIFGIILGLSSVEILIIILAFATVIMMEFLNTAIESAVDLSIKKSYHDLAKIAKDCSGGAVMLSAIIAIVIDVILLLPPLSKLIISAINL